MALSGVLPDSLFQFIERSGLRGLIREQRLMDIV
jgi:hypothetical protein